MRQRIRMFVFAPALVFASACSKDKPVDPTLNNDLSLAAQARTSPLDSISSAERMKGGMAPVGVPANGLAPGAVAAPAPARRTADAPVHRTATRRSSGSSGSGTSRRSSGTYSAPATHEEIHKNTKRDAAIGAGAGAVIGGLGSHSVKGGVIGAAAGAILGGVIGNNVDIQKKRVP